MLLVGTSKGFVCQNVRAWRKRMVLASPCRQVLMSPAILSITQQQAYTCTVSVKVRTWTAGWRTWDVASTACQTNVLVTQTHTCTHICICNTHLHYLSANPHAHTQKGLHCIQLCSVRTSDVINPGLSTELPPSGRCWWPVSCRQNQGIADCQVSMFTSKVTPRSHST